MAASVAGPARKIAVRVGMQGNWGLARCMRCLALADALSKDGCTLHFVCRHLLITCDESVTRSLGLWVTLHSHTG